ncbi:MAG: hypothetical protein QM811_08470 [Pirellulales bacterium]
MPSNDAPIRRVSRASVVVATKPVTPVVVPFGPIRTTPFPDDSNRRRSRKSTVVGLAVVLGPSSKSPGPSTVSLPDPMILEIEVDAGTSENDATV